jgi:hypothetical protein
MFACIAFRSIPLYMDCTYDDLIHNQSITLYLVSIRDYIFYYCGDSFWCLSTTSMFCFGVYTVPDIPLGTRLLLILHTHWMKV